MKTLLALVAFLIVILPGKELDAECSPGIAAMGGRGPVYQQCIWRYCCGKYGCWGNCPCGG